MAKLAQISIKDFKRATDVTFDVTDVNVLVGGNNSGKSSVIQGLHFVIALLQSLALAKKFRRTGSATISPEELIYSPAQNPYRLYSGGYLQQNTYIKFRVVLDSGDEIEVSLTKGKNANLSVAVGPIEIAQKLSSLTSPFSIYSPGLAGIARSESYASDGVLLRAVSRGDANLFLRNIIYRLEKLDRWADFVDDLQSLFGPLSLNVIFDAASDESIIVELVLGEKRVPLESCGTGLLQAIQILSYVYYFGPSVMILDEPDSHLHPNNQRLLCDIIRRIGDELNCQVVLTTHSRHILDALRQSARLLWVQNGQARPAGLDDHLDVLMDLGALDIREIAQIPTRAFVLAEDKDSDGLREVLLSSGFDEGDFVLQSYYGVTDPHRLKVIISVIKEFQPQALVIVHRDRDYLQDDEVEAWKRQVRALRAEPFVTDGRDIEDYFITAEYLSERPNNLTALEAAELIQTAVENLKEETVSSYVNGRLDILRLNRQQANPGAIAAEAAREVARDARSAVKGKRLRSEVRRLYRERRGRNLIVRGASDLLRIPGVEALLRQLPRRLPPVQPH